MMHLPITHAAPGQTADLAQLAAAFADDYAQEHADGLPVLEAVAEVDHALEVGYFG